MLYISKGWGGGRTNILIYHISGGTDTNKYITYIILYILIAKTGGDGQFQNRDTTTHTQTDRHHFGFLIEISTKTHTISKTLTFPHYQFAEVWAYYLFRN